MVGVDDGLALHEATGVGDLHLPQPLEVEDAGVEQQPGQHLVIGHRLRDVIDGEQGVRACIAGDRFEISVPVLTGLIEEIQKAAADAVDRGDLQLARPDRLIEGACLQCLGALHGKARIVDVKRDGADTGTVRHVMRMREAVGLAIDHELDLALRPALHRLAAMLAGFAEAELRQQTGKLAGPWSR